jgi:hypothetical protein
MYGNAVQVYSGRPDNHKQSDASFAGAVCTVIRKPSRVRPVSLASWLMFFARAISTIATQLFMPRPLIKKPLRSIHILMQHTDNKHLLIRSQIENSVMLSLNTNWSPSSFFGQPL